MALFAALLATFSNSCKVNFDSSKLEEVFDVILDDVFDSYKVEETEDVLLDSILNDEEVVSPQDKSKDPSVNINNNFAFFITN